MHEGSQVEGETITLTDLMGREISVTGSLESVDLVKNAITIKAMTSGAEKTAGLGTGKKRYEMIREIFNSCANNQMRDVDIREIETGDVDAFIKDLLSGAHVQCEKIVQDNGAVVFNINADGLSQRISFTELAPAES
ncbi:hypothetical protein FACS189468_1840 [Spirochaetia bacterium]|nr:hypothetical protein FACS189468_1840 [Spirochaetia bacterium]